MESHAGDTSIVSNSSATNRVRHLFNQFLEQDDGAPERKSPRRPEGKRSYGTASIEARKLQQQIGQLKAEVLDMRTDKLSLEEQMRHIKLELQHEKNLRESDRQVYEQGIKLNTETVADLERDRARLREREKSLHEQLDDTQKALQDARQLRTQLIELTSENARLQQQVETLETSPNFDIEREKRQVASLQSKLEFAQREAELLRQQQDALEAEAARAMEQEAHATQRCHQLEGQLAQAKLELSKASCNSSSLNESLTAADGRLLRQLQADNKHLRQSVENQSLLKEKLATSESRTQKLERQVTQLHEQLHALESMQLFKAQWEECLASGINGLDVHSSPVEMISILRHLQQREAVLIYKCETLSQEKTNLEQRTKDKAAAYTELETKLQSTVQELDKLRKESTKTQGKLVFLRKEKESLEALTKFDRSSSFTRELVAENEKLKKEVADLKAAAPPSKSMSAQGRGQNTFDTTPPSASRLDYDPATTKVVHLKDNPISRAADAFVRDLLDENSKLKEEIAAQCHGTATSSVETAKLKKELQDARIKEDRLQTVFKEHVAKFRRACQELFGYSIELVNSSEGARYRLLSIYAGTAADDFRFQEDNQSFQVLDTSFLRQWNSEASLYIGERGSIPAFLAEVTRQLFETSTVM